MDHMANQMAEVDGLEYAYPELRSYDSKFSWVAKDGKILDVRNMTDTHITNVVNYFLRRATQIRFSIPFPNFMGEYAQYSAECEYDNIMQMENLDLVLHVIPRLDNVCREALLRGLWQTWWGYVPDEFEGCLGWCTTNDNTHVF